MGASSSSTANRGDHRSSSSSTANRGDHIYAVDFLYNHHGIYVGDNMVIHFRPAAKKSSNATRCPNCGYNPDSDFGIIKTCLPCFAEGRSVYVNHYKVSACKSVDEVVDTATNFFLHGGFGAYDPVTNNCEHFACYCKTGKREVSAEVILFVVKIGVAAAFCNIQ